jgi:hypothetical protein
MATYGLRSFDAPLSTATAPYGAPLMSVILDSFRLMGAKR